MYVYTHVLYIVDSVNTRHVSVVKPCTWPDTKAGSPYRPTQFGHIPAQEWGVDSQDLLLSGDSGLSHTNVQPEYTVKTTEARFGT